MHRNITKNKRTILSNYKIISTKNNNFFLVGNNNNNDKSDYKIVV